MEELRRYEGWLNVWDTDGAVEGKVFGEGRMIPEPPWGPYFCVLREDHRTFTCYSSEEQVESSSLKRVRLDGCKAEFDKRWGYETLDIIKENAINHNKPSSMRQCKSAEELHLYEPLWSPNPLWSPSPVFADSPAGSTPNSSPAYSRHASPRGSLTPALSPGLLMAFPASLGAYTGQRRHSCVSIMPEPVTNTPDRFSRSRLLDNRCNESLPDSSYEKLQERRGSAPLVTALLDDQGQDDLMDTGSTSSKIANFFMKKGFKSNLKRTKSVTKLDQRKRSTTNVDNEGSTIVNSLRRTMSLGRLNRKRNRETNSGQSESPLQQQSSLNIINSRIRSSRSHESLLTSPPSTMSSVDLTGEGVDIKPLHASILGKEHCFQVSTSHGSKYISCRTTEEQQRWIGSLRKNTHPNREKIRRMDNSLKLWIKEAKNVPSKKRYYCEICLDHTLYARTSGKCKADMLFWGEHFEFNNLPEVRMVTVNLYREADKKKKKDKNAKIGYVNIPVSEITGRQYIEKWFTTSSGTVGKTGKENKSELPLIRLKLRYHPIQILPLEYYNKLSEYLTTEYVTLSEVMENIVGVRDKEDIATTMIHILQKLDKAKLFLTDVVISEVTRQDNETLTFRGNSIATKAMEAYMKLVGEKYLSDTLSDFVRSMINSEDDCEVDPTKLLANPSSLHNHQKLLDMYCDMVWAKIINSHCYFPSELREIFSSFRAQCEEQSKSQIADNLIRGSIFLRFLCPAILSPSLFNLIQEFPPEKAARNLTLIAKTIQTLANSAKFGGKEDFMIFMNDFIERHNGSLRAFLDQISSTEGSNQFLEYDGYIDLGKELSLLHTLLIENLEKANQDTLQKLGKLPDILQEITTAIEDPEVGKTLPSKRKSQIYDNVVTPAGTSPTEILRDMLRHCGEEDIPVLGARNAKQGSFDSESVRSLSGTMNSEELVSSHVLTSRCDSEVSNVSASSNTMDNEQSVNQSWSEIVNAAEGNHGDYIDLISFIDDDPQNSSMELEQNINGSQISISQISTVASSGYQSYGYSQSSSPVESTSNRLELSRDLNKSPSTQSSLQPLSFSNPMYRHKMSLKLSSQDSSVTPQKSTNLTSGSASSEEDTLRIQSPMKTDLSPQSPDYLCNLAPKLSSSSSSESLDQDHLRFTSSHSKSNNGSDSGKFDLHSSCPSEVFEDFHNSNFSTQSSNQTFYNSSGSTRPMELSHTGSMDFLYLRNNSPYEGLRRTATDSLIAKGDHAVYVNANVGMSHSASHDQVTPEDSPHRRLSQQNAVHMGIRSVQRKIMEQEKTKQEYEQEVEVLKKQLQEAQERLQNAEKKLNEHESGTQMLMEDWHNRLEESEERMRRQQAEKDDQMKNIIQRLMNVEDELRHDQEEMQNIVYQKQKVIEAQERRIQTLDTANAKLMSALNQLRNVSQANHNGMLGPLKSTLISSELAEFKTSSC